MKVRSQTFTAKDEPDAWQAACDFGQEKLNEGYTTVLVLTSLSKLAKKYDVPAHAVMVRYWGKPAS